MEEKPEERRAVTWQGPEEEPGVAETEERKTEEGPEMEVEVKEKESGGWGRGRRSQKRKTEPREPEKGTGKEGGVRRGRGGTGRRGGRVRT